MCEREQRGLVIAAVCKIVQKGKAWLVPSLNSAAKYTVIPDEQAPHCSCLDHETRGCICKHIFAVRCVINREQEADGSETITKTMTITETTTKRPTYPQNWPAYNAAQTNEKRHFRGRHQNSSKKAFSSFWRMFARFMSREAQSGQNQTDI